MPLGSFRLNSIARTLISDDSSAEYFAAVGSSGPRIELYKVVSDTYTKLSNPNVLPAGTGNGAEFSPDGTYLATAYSGSPFIVIYKRTGDTFTKVADPDVLPTSTCWDVSWDPNGTILYVTSSASPFFFAYSRTGDTFTKIADPSTIPDVESRGVHTDSTGTYVAVCPRTSSTTNLIVYKRSGTTYTTVLTNKDAAGNTLYCDLSKNADYLSVGLENSPFVRIYKRSGDTFTALSTPFSGSTLSPTTNTRSAIFSPDGNYLAVQQQVSPFNIIFKRNGDTWQSISSSADVGTWNGDGANWNKPSTYVTYAGSSTPFIKTYKRSGDTFTAISDPSTLPSGSLRDGGWYPGPYSYDRAPNLIYPINGAKISTAQSVFGGSSLDLTRSSTQYIYTSRPVIPELGEFTIECWIRPKATGTRYDFLSQFWGGLGRTSVYTRSDNRFEAFIGDGTLGNTQLISTASYTANTWHHVVLLRDSGNIFRMYVNGNLEASSTAKATPIYQGAPFAVGVRWTTFPSTSGPTDAFIDEVRVSDIARYSANFTPATAPFVNDENTLLLLHMDGANNSTDFSDDNGA